MVLGRRAKSKTGQIAVQPDVVEPVEPAAPIEPAEVAAPPSEPEIRGIVDGFIAPATVLGWAVKRVDGGLVHDLVIQAWRGGEMIGSAAPAGPRPDVTGDETSPAAFALACPPGVTTQDLLTHDVVLRVVDSDGRSAPVPIWEATRKVMSEVMVLDLVRHAGSGVALEMLGALAENTGLAEAPDQVQAINQKLAALTRKRPGRRGQGPKIAFIGAGSTVFAKNLIGDVLLRPDLASSRIHLHDIDKARLDVSETVARRIKRSLDSRATIESTLDLGEALDGADFAITMIQVGGFAPGTLADFEVPKRFGLRQSIGDTIGIGGIMRGLRTVPVLLGMAREMEKRCPDVLHLNYSNPMAINCWALSRASRIRTVGLCHSVPMTAAELAGALGLPADAVSYQVAGINHMAFFLKLQHGQEDLYPRLREIVSGGRVPDHDRVRFDLLRRLGFFVTESSEHVAEYVPWYIKRGQPGLISRFNVPLDEYPRRCRRQIAEWEQLAKTLTDGSARLDVVPSQEYGSAIIEAVTTGEACSVYANVPNTGIISNLPDGCCVEVPCTVDRNGVQPVHVGPLPPQLAALIQTNVSVQGLTVEAALSGRREHIYHAAMLDPHTGSELDLDQIWELVDAMLEVHRDYLPAEFFAAA